MAQKKTTFLLVKLLKAVLSKIEVKFGCFCAEKYQDWSVYSGQQIMFCNS